MDLSPTEVRVLGALVEKDLATPQAYPLTLNALRLACNQATGRDPVVAYGDHEVEAALASLRERGLTRVVYSTSNRAAKHRHVLGEAWGLDRPELAALAVLALRGPQTVGEVKGRTERMHPYADLARAEAALDALAAHDPPLATRLERRPGQKDHRYQALLGPAPDPADAAPTGTGPGATAPPTTPPPVPDPGAAGRVDELAGEVAALRADLDALRAEVRALLDELA